MKIYLGKNIKYLSEYRNLGQQELADILSVPRSTLACWENDLRNPKLEQIVKIAEFFNTNLDIIYKDLENNVLSSSKEKEHSEEYKKILKEKGLMDDDENIDEESLNKLLKIADMIDGINKKEN